MDFGLREWLILIGLLVIAGILFDGWRRVGGRSRIRFTLERDLKGLPDAPERDELLGPARVIPHRERAEPSLGDEFDTAIESERSARRPEQAGLDFDEAVLEADDHVTSPGLSGETRETRENGDVPVAERAEKTERKIAETSVSEPAPFEEVLIIIVVARNEEGFPGAAMQQSIMESGLRYGAMDIYHRHESMTGNGDVLFSMANALKPGTFNPDELEHSHVRAVSFFMGLPGPRHPKQALDLMIASARKLAQELGGDLKDESRSVLTAQTIEHYRQRIAEYERKRLGLRR